MFGYHIGAETDFNEDEVGIVGISYEEGLNDLGKSIFGCDNILHVQFNLDKDYLTGYSEKGDSVDIPIIDFLTKAKNYADSFNR